MKSELNFTKNINFTFFHRDCLSVSRTVPIAVSDFNDFLFEGLLLGNPFLPKLFSNSVFLLFSLPVRQETCVNVWVLFQLFLGRLKIQHLIRRIIVRIHFSLNGSDFRLCFTAVVLVIFVFFILVLVKVKRQGLNLKDKISCSDSKFFGSGC